MTKYVTRWTVDELKALIDPSGKSDLDGLSYAQLVCAKNINQGKPTLPGLATKRNKRKANQ